MLGGLDGVHALIEAFELVDDMETIDAPLIAGGGAEDVSRRRVH
jgi:hypothetical protein